MTSLVRVYHLMGKYMESLELLNEMQKLYSETDELERGGLAIVEGRLSAVHHLLNNRAESIKHFKGTLKRVQAMQKADPTNIGELVWQLVHDYHVNVLLTIGIVIALTCLGPVYSELDEASLKDAERVLEITKEKFQEPYFHYTRMVAQLGRVKQLRHKPPEEARNILEELQKQTKLPHDHIGEFKIYISHILS